MAKQLVFMRTSTASQRAADFLGKIPLRGIAGRQLAEWIQGNERKFSPSAVSRINEFGVILVNSDGTPTTLFLDAISLIKNNS